MKTNVFLDYTIFLNGNTLPTLSIPMASMEAGLTAQHQLLTSSVVEDIKANGGSISVTIRVEVTP